MEATLKIPRFLLPCIHSKQSQARDSALASLAHHMNLRVPLGDSSASMQYSLRAPSLGRGLGIRYRRGKIPSAGQAFVGVLFFPVQHLEKVSPMDLSAMCRSTDPILLCCSGAVSANAHRGACLAQSIAIRYTVTQLRRVFQKQVRKQRNCISRIPHGMRFTLWE